MPTYLVFGLVIVEVVGFVWALVLFREPLRQEVDEHGCAYISFIGLLLLVVIGWPLLLYSHFKQEWSSEADRRREAHKRV